MGKAVGVCFGGTIRSYVLDIQSLQSLLDSGVECTNLEYRREVWPRGTHLGIHAFTAMRLN